ncbi:MarR family transcriptional regulator [Streptomyces sp. ACA25]|uniref:helix-turn-helix transcriptional regulator n=1 Tax=Streptomyces sp. ACA25 TaxID=3022596 RepID=UPI002307F047|nr:MarR family transcriptional regulator [Streptomyces sp. ACA25]MDB1086794.1 MarR family transcriptional regulator [Streptomyces sp. ACA25]
MTDPGIWSYKEIAAHIRVQPATVRAYRKHGLLPSPDLVRAGRPLWYAETIRQWVTRRPSQRRRHR